MSSDEYTADEHAQLLSVAFRSIDHGLEHGSPLAVSVEDFPLHLRSERACFVTLRSDGELRGCTGAIIARVPLVVCVAAHAFTSAFRDFRFPSLVSGELPDLEVAISVLSDPEPISFADETDLITHLRPGVDGLILSEAGELATLLPSVWDSIPEPQQFLRQLKRKAGLPGGYWSPTIGVSRYTTEQFFGTHEDP